MTDEELTDLIQQAISDSLDVDWHSGDGARAVVRALREAGLLPLRAAALDEVERLRRALVLAMPVGVCLTNKNIPDSTTVPLEITMGDLRIIRAALGDAS